MNQRLPAVGAREVIRALQRAGFVVSRISGSHCRLVHSIDPARKVTVPMHTGDLKRGTCVVSSRKPVSPWRNSSIWCDLAADRGCRARARSALVFSSACFYGARTRSIQIGRRREGAAPVSFTTEELLADVIADLIADV